ncbi:hypothetical protein ITJ38_05535 [Agreia pratensis]|uniref:hypothetical protein n=1 Tax=Microbacteriaceae TaxID=85023 RepID=UPI00188C9726|nr:MULTISPECIES: hypothetical protein [Microbacteriaceae]MBF4561252.1 hypothetical protein [Microbacterium sp. VKM Ac-2870]MBF4633859.1 hypothetical protein [Agreia pratensis]
MSKIQNTIPAWQHVAATLHMMVLAVLNTSVLVLLLVVRPEPFLLLLLRTTFALLLSMYAMYLTRGLRDRNNRRVIKVLTIITAYALLASAIFLWLVDNPPWWVVVTQWVTVVIYIAFGLLLATLPRERSRT